MMARSSLPDFLPIRRILKGGVVQRFVTDVDFDGEDFETEVDLSAGVLRVLAGKLQKLPPNAVPIEPSGDTTGSTDRAALVAALALGPVRAAPGGVFYIDQRIDVPSGADIDLGEDSWIYAGSAFAATSADDRNGSMIRVAGATTGAVSTTISTSYWMRDADLTLTSGTGLANGQWLRLLGTNAADLAYGQSDAEVLFELAEVASFAGAVVTLQSKLGGNHAFGKPVVSYAPNIGTKIQNLNLDANGKLIAVGLELEGCVRLELGYVSGRGFSRTVVSEYGCKSTVREELVSRGGNNMLHHIDSCQFGLTKLARSTSEGLRVHASGIPRAMVWLDGHCVGEYMERGQFEHVGVGYRIHGGYGCGFGSLMVHDCDPTAAIARDATLQGNIVGAAFDGGMNDLAGASFGWNNSFGQILVSGMDFNSYDTCCVYFHDSYQNSFADIQILNKGRTPLTATNAAVGVVMADVSGTIGSINAQGVYRSTRTKNVVCRVNIDSIVHDPRGGQGSVANTTVWITHGGGLGTSPVVKHIRADSNSNIFVCGSPWTSTPDRTFCVDRLTSDGYDHCMVMPMPATGTIVAGDVVRFNGSNTASREAIGPHRTNAVAVDTQYNGWCAIAHGKSLAKHTGTAAVIGNWLEANAANQLVVNDAATGATTQRFKALSPSFSGLVQVVPG